MLHLTEYLSSRNRIIRPLPKPILSAGSRCSNPSKRLLRQTLVCGGILSTQINEMYMIWCDAISSVQDAGKKKANDIHLMIYILQFNQQKSVC